MALSELDTSPAQHASGDPPAFSTARRGYDPTEVDVHLSALAGRLERLEEELQRSRTRTELLERKLSSAQESAYARIFRQLMEVMRSAESAAARVREAAEEEASARRAEAAAEADRRVAEAREEAERVTAAARELAERLTEAARRERDGLVSAGAPAAPDEAEAEAEEPGVETGRTGDNGIGPADEEFASLRSRLEWLKAEELRQEAAVEATPTDAAAAEGPERGADWRERRRIESLLPEPPPPEVWWAPESPAAEADRPEPPKANRPEPPKADRPAPPGVAVANRDDGPAAPLFPAAAEEESDDLVIDLDLFWEGDGGG